MTPTNRDRGYVMDMYDSACLVREFSEGKALRKPGVRENRTPEICS